MHRSGSFMDEREPFLGRISSMKGVRRGYVWSRDWRRLRCTDDLSFDLGANGRLEDGQLVGGRAARLRRRTLS